MKALIIGATGATGRDLVNRLLADDRYTEIVVFVRRSAGIMHPKYREIITDFSNPEQVWDEVKGDVFFSCLGTTLKIAGSKDKQWQIDYEIPARFAAVARRNAVPRMVLLSAYGATSGTRVFYSRMKGKLEDHMEALNFPQYIIFRPGLLLRQNTDRFGEKLAAGVLKFVNRLGMARKFRPLPTKILAQKMSDAPHVFGGGKHVIELSKIFE